MKFLIENGIINEPSTETDLKNMNQKNRMYYLEKHPFTIWSGKNNSRYYTYLPDETMARNRRQVSRSSKKEIEDLIVEYWKEKETNPTLEELFDRWNDRRLELKKISEATHFRYKADFNKYFSAGFCNETINGMEVTDFSDFLEEKLAEFNLTSKAFVNLKTLVKGIVRQAKKEKLINYTPDAVIQELDVSDRSFKKTIKEDYEEVFDDNETKKMIDYLMDNQDLRNLGILLMFVTGIRVGELVALKPGDIKGCVVSIRRTESCVQSLDGKGNKYIIKEFPKTAAGVRDVVVPKDFEWLLEKLSRIPTEFIFMDKDVRMNTFYFRRRLYRICKKLDVYQKSPHKVRKTYGTILLDNNTDKEFIKNQMGHSSIGVTESSYHRNRKSDLKKQEILSNIPDFSLNKIAQ